MTINLLRFLDAPLALRVFCSRVGSFVPMNVVSSSLWSKIQVIGSMRLNLTLYPKLFTYKISEF
jgi:hypothetical protein